MTGGDRFRADGVLIAALAGGSTVEDAAATAGVGVATAYRRLKEPEFRRRIDDARAEVIAAAVARLGAASGKAVTTLEDLLTAESEAVRLGAARATLDAALKWREHQDLAERVRLLEEQLTPEQGGTRRWAG